jgi:hypothetical protein
MAIPGHDFSISCLSDNPNNTNIIYTGFDAVNELNRLHGLQQTIIDRFETMSKAARLYDKTHPLCATFQKEKMAQAKAYEDFQAALKKNNNYNARFLPIVNLMQGYAHRLSDDEYEKGLIFNAFFTQKMNIQDLYVSGHWEGIIQSWVGYQANVVNDKNKFEQDFKVLNDKIANPVQYTDFVSKVTFYLTQYGKDNYIEAIAPMVIRSGKVTAYEGKTMQVYVTAMIGSQAPDLVLPDGKTLKSQDLAQGGYEQTLLLFFDTGCGHCEEVIKQLQSQYTGLQAKKIRLMTFAADTDEAAYQKAIATYPWKDNYCDLKSMAGINFTNYAVPGTPTLYLLDKKGMIVQKSASLAELLQSDNETISVSKKVK